MYLESNEYCPVIILTRFNLAIKYNFEKLYKNRDVNEVKLWLDVDYLKRRFEIFEKYTLESLMKQTDMNYKWIILFHQDTPEQFKEIINCYKNKLNNIDVWYLDDDDSQRYSELVSEYLRKEYANQEIITIRLDNDDAIHQDFVLNVRKRLKEEKGEVVLSFENGLQYNIKDKRMLKFPFKTNHFVSVKCNAQDEKNNALDCEHMKINEQYDRVIYMKTDMPQWVEIVSDTNCVNEIHYRLGRIFVGDNLREEYPFVEFKWDDKESYVFYILRSVFLVSLREVGYIVKELYRRVRNAYR